MFVDLTGTKKKFLKKNEGNAWYFDKSHFYGDFPYYDYGHSALYYISGGKEYLVSLYPGSEDGIFTRDVPTSYHNSDDDIKEYYQYAKEIGQNIGKVNGVDATYIDNKYINTSKIAERQNIIEKDTSHMYNTYLNNCSGEIVSALKAGGFFSENTTTYIRFPSELTFDIRVQLHILNIKNFIN